MTEKLQIETSPFVRIRYDCVKSMERSERTVLIKYNTVSSSSSTIPWISHLPNIRLVKHSTPSMFIIMCAVHEDEDGLVLREIAVGTLSGKIVRDFHDSRRRKILKVVDLTNR